MRTPRSASTIRPSTNAIPRTERRNSAKNGSGEDSEKTARRRSSVRLARGGERRANACFDFFVGAGDFSGSAIFFDDSEKGGLFGEVRGVSAYLAYAASQVLLRVRQGVLHRGGIAPRQLALELPEIGADIVIHRPFL
jgi:hypothetical protein